MGKKRYDLNDLDTGRTPVPLWAVPPRCGHLQVSAYARTRIGMQHLSESSLSTSAHVLAARGVAPMGCRHMPGLYFDARTFFFNEASISSMCVDYVHDTLVLVYEENTI